MELILDKCIVIAEVSRWFGMVSNSELKWTTKISHCELRLPWCGRHADQLIEFLCVYRPSNICMDPQKIEQSNPTKIVIIHTFSIFLVVALLWLPCLSWSSILGVDWELNQLYNPSPIGVSENGKNHEKSFTSGSVALWCCFSLLLLKTNPRIWTNW